MTGPMRTASTGDHRAGEVPDVGTARGLASAIPGEGHERTGVAVYVTVRDLAGAGRTSEGTGGVRPEEGAVVDGARVAGGLRRWHALLDGGDDDHGVQEASTAMAWWHVRTHLPGERPEPGEQAPPGGPVLAGSHAAARQGVLEKVTAALGHGNVLRVVNYHSTPARLADLVAQEIADYAARYCPVGPADVRRFLDTGRWDTPRPPLVLGFFDGFRNNAEVAAPVCDRVGATAWFHLPTHFLDASSRDQPDFAHRHVIRVAPEEVVRGERLAMTWDDVADLAERHAVGAHTATHATEAAVLDAAAVEREVSGPLRRVAQVTGRPADAFTWLGGTPFDATSDAGRVIADAGVPWFVSGLALERLPPAAR